MTWPLSTLSKYIWNPMKRKMLFWFVSFSADSNVQFKWKTGEDACCQPLESWINIFCIQVNMWWFRKWFFQQNLMIYSFSFRSKVNWQIWWKMQLTEKVEEKKEETKSILKLFVGFTFRTSNVSEIWKSVWFYVSIDHCFVPQFLRNQFVMVETWNDARLFFDTFLSGARISISFFYYPQKHSKL